MPVKPRADFHHFEALDIRVGRVLAVEDAATRKPAYRIRVDFGGDVGVRVSCGAFRHYPKAALIGKQVVGVLNFESKRMGPEVSEVLLLGVPGTGGGTIYLTPESEVEPGAAVF